MRYIQSLFLLEAGSVNRHSASVLSHYAGTCGGSLCSRNLYTAFFETKPPNSVDVRCTDTTPKVRQVRLVTPSAAIPHAPGLPHPFYLWKGLNGRTDHGQTSQTMPCLECKRERTDRPSRPRPRPTPRDRDPLSVRTDTSGPPIPSCYRGFIVTKEIPKLLPGNDYHRYD